MKALLDHDNESCISLLVNLPRKLKLKILDIPPFIKIDLSTRYPRKNHTRIRAIKHPKDRKPFAHSIFFHRYTRNYRQIFPFFYFFFSFLHAAIFKFQRIFQRDQQLVAVCESTRRLTKTSRMLKVTDYLD